MALVRDEVEEVAQGVSRIEMSQMSQSFLKFGFGKFFSTHVTTFKEFYGLAAFISCISEVFCFIYIYVEVLFFENKFTGPQHECHMSLRSFA